MKTAPIPRNGLCWLPMLGIRYSTFLSLPSPPQLGPAPQPQPGPLFVSLWGQAPAFVFFFSHSAMNLSFSAPDRFFAAASARQVLLGSAHVGSVPETKRAKHPLIIRNDL